MPVFNQSRQNVIRLIFLATFLIIVARLFSLQIVSGKYKSAAWDNAVYKKVVYPDRGIIYDRKGKAILNNTIIFDLMVTPAEIKNVDTNYLCNLLAIDTSEFNRRMKNVLFKNRNKYMPSVFEDLLPPDMQARLEENIWRFPGFTLVERPIRVYPFRAAAHLLGYIGEVDSAILKRSNFYYQLGDYVGRSGMEQYYETVLMGQRGVQYLIKDNRNRIQGSLNNGANDTAATAGRNLRTYLDIDLQQLAEKLMTNKVGSIVALDPKTGGVLAMASGPGFDPNDLTGPEKQKNYARMVLDVSGPLLNRSINGRYEPGSAFKPIGGLVALNEGMITPSYGYPCSGVYLACAKPIKCEHNNAGHAANLRLALANSCNSYFSQVYRLVVDNPQYHSVKNGYMKWKEYLNAFGLGHRLEIDLPGEDPGNIPDTSVYNKDYRGAWNSCTNVTLGIGQDKMQATPLQLANAMCIIANKGYYYIPHLAEKFDGEAKEDLLLNKYRQKHEVLTHISDDAYEAIHSGMQDVVEHGTAVAARIPGIDICAKTGTAEKYTILDGKRIKLPNNSMFVCFAPRENPKIAIAVAVENAGFGATWAAPIASLLIEKYLNDTLRAERLKEVDRIASANLMPAYLKRKQYVEDSARAYYYFNLYKDSSYLYKFLEQPRVKPVSSQKSGEKAVTIHKEPVIGDDNRRNILKPKTNLIAA